MAILAKGRGAGEKLLGRLQSAVKKRAAGIRGVLLLPLAAPGVDDSAKRAPWRSWDLLLQTTDGQGRRGSSGCRGTSPL